MDMHNHVAASTPWLLVAGLLVCVLISLVRLADSAADLDSDVAHLLMNSTMVTMMLDATMSLGRWWFAVTVTIAVVLVMRMARNPNTTRLVHAASAVLMIAATYVMLSGATGGWFAMTLAAVIMVEVVATGLALLVGNRAPILVLAGAAGTPSSEPSPAGWRLAAVPHIGMGVGMLAMLVGW